MSASSHNLFPPQELNERPVLGPEVPAGWQRRKKKIAQSYWAAEQDDQSGIPLSTRMSLLRRFGGFTLAYSTAVQPTLRHEGDNEGYIAYRNRWNMRFGLGDPVAPRAKWAERLDRFIEDFRRPSFVQVSGAVAEILSTRGYFTTPMGIDTSLKLDNYSLAGKKKEWLRYAFNWVTKRGFCIQEMNFSSLSRKSVADLSEAWRSTRTVKRKEVRFLNRPIVLEDESDVRKFFLIDPSGKPVAFVFLDPIYHQGQITGYATSFKRRHPEAPQYAEHAVMKQIIETLKSENVSELKLGLSPFCPATESSEKSVGKSNPLSQWLFSKAYHSKWINQLAYHVQGHAAYKKRFRGDEEIVYYASPGRFDVVRLAALIGLCGVA